MRRFPSRWVFLIPLVGLSPSPGATDDGPAVEPRSEAARRHGLDPTSPVESRIGPTPAPVLKMFEGLGDPLPTPHALTEAERSKVSAALAALPPLHRRTLAGRLRRLSFLDGMPNTALMSTVNPDEPHPVFDITVRAGVLGETVSDWLTQKERGCFDAAGSPLSVTVEAGPLDALVYVLLHEATHVVDSCLRLTPAPPANPHPGDGAVAPTEFTAGVWSDRLLHAPRFRDPHLDRIKFRPGGRVAPIDQAEAVYKTLGRTPFVSLYGSSKWHDDLAEYAAVFHMTEKLGQPYRIAVRRQGEVVLLYEPMKSDLVRGRIGQMGRFYAGAD